MASAFGCGSDSNRVSVLFPVAYGWIKGIYRGVGLGVFVGAGVAAARPHHSAWPHLRATPFFMFDTSIGCALHVECHGVLVDAEEVRAHWCLARDATTFSSSG